MVDSSFFFFIAIAILTFSTQGSLQTFFARKYDALVVTLYRNLSLAVTMLPVFLFVSAAEILEIREHAGTLVLACATGAFALLCSLSSSRYMPIGISSAIRQMVHVTVAVFLGMLFLNEYLTIVQLVIITGIVLSAISLSLLRSEYAHLNPNTVGKGILLTIAAGAGAALTFYFFSILSREMNPLVASYFWEVGVGIFALVYLGFLVAIQRYDSRVILPGKDALIVVSLALLTIPATLSYAFAVNHGPYALAAGMMTMTTLVTTVIGWMLYKEILRKVQVIFIVVAIALMFLLKMLS